MVPDLTLRPLSERKKETVRATVATSSSGAPGAFTRATTGDKRTAVMRFRRNLAINVWDESVRRW